MQRFKLFALSLTVMLLLSSVAESAVVGFQGRHFFATGGRGGGQGASPCCGLAGTFSNRTTGYVTSVTTSGTLAFPAGFPYFAQMPFGSPYIAGDVDPANGALTVPNGAFQATSILSPPLFPGWLFFVQTRTSFFPSAMFAAGQGPGTWSYMATENPYTRMQVNQHPTAAGTTTTTSTVNWNLAGKASGIAGANQYGGTWSVIGTSTNYLAIVGQGTVREILIPIPNGPGVPLPNGPAGVVISRQTTDSFVKIHVGTINGPVVAEIVGPVVNDAFPWTTGTMMFDNTSYHSIIANPLSYAQRTDMGNDARTTASYLNGNLQLVSGSLGNSFTGGNPISPSPSSFTRLVNLDMVPEPGSLALIGSGVLGLVGFSLASRRQRR